MRKHLFIYLMLLSIIKIQAQDQSNPNILFIAIDDLKPTLGIYGDSFAVTPNIDAIAKNGTTFLNNHTQQAICGPSRASLLTGKRPDYTKVWDLKTKMRDVNPTILTIMTDDDGDGSWTAVQTTITTQPTAVNSWVQQTGTYSNDISRQVRIKFSKSGGTTAEPTNLQELMYIDDVSLKYNGATLGVSDQDIMSFSIYPNPATDLISISGVDNIKSIKVYSILGSLEKEVFNTNQIDISELSSGIHLIKVDNGTGTAFTEKIIKQ